MAADTHRVRIRRQIQGGGSYGTGRRTPQAQKVYRAKCRTLQVQQKEQIIKYSKRPEFAKYSTKAGIYEVQCNVGIYSKYNVAVISKTQTHTIVKFSEGYNLHTHIVYTVQEDGGLNINKE